jgi:hypothetical protein
MVFTPEGRSKDDEEGVIEIDLLSTSSVREGEGEEEEGVAEEREKAVKDFLMTGFILPLGAILIADTIIAYFVLHEFFRFDPAFLLAALWHFFFFGFLLWYYLTGSHTSRGNLPSPKRQTSLSLDIGNHDALEALVGIVWFGAVWLMLYDANVVTTAYLQMSDIASGVISCVFLLTLSVLVHCLCHQPIMIICEMTAIQLMLSVVTDLFADQWDILIVVSLCIAIFSFVVTIFRSGKTREIFTWIHAGCAFILFLHLLMSPYDRFTPILLDVTLIVLILTGMLVPSSMSVSFSIFLFLYHVSGLAKVLDRRRDSSDTIRERCLNASADLGYLGIMIVVLFTLLLLGALTLIFFSSFCACLSAYLPCFNRLRWLIRRCALSLFSE